MEQRVNNPALTMFMNARHRAKGRNLPFSITIEDVKMTEACPCCGEAFLIGAPTGRAVPRAPSLDRKIPEKGYVPGNVVVICHRCNTLKRDGTLAEFEALTNWLRTL